MEHDSGIGRRILELRTWRGLPQKTLAALAGYSPSYVSKIEHGQRDLTSRRAVEAFARALRVHPVDLTGGTLLVQGLSEEHAAVHGLRTAVAVIDFGEPVTRPVPGWETVRVDLDAMNALRPGADYVGLGRCLPDLVVNLHAHAEGPHQRAALTGLVDAYSATEFAAKEVGAPDLAQVAARHIRDVTEKLAGPEWTGLAAWARAHAIAGAARETAYQVVMHGADELAGELDDPRVADMYGMLHLTAALASVAHGKLDDATAHVTEAADISRRPGVGTNFAHLNFGAGNVEIWRALLAVESGDGGRAVEIARAVDPATLPASPKRRAALHIEAGRGLAMDRRTADEAVVEFLAAERLTASYTHTNPWVRQIVTTRLQRARRDAGGREARGLAYRMGIAV